MNQPPFELPTYLEPTTGGIDGSPVFTVDYVCYGYPRVIDNFMKCMHVFMIRVRLGGKFAQCEPVDLCHEINESTIAQAASRINDLAKQFGPQEPSALFVTFPYCRVVGSLVVFDVRGARIVG